MSVSQVDVVLPCYNPLPGWTANILASMARIQELLPQAQLHLYLVNDGSSKTIEPADIKTLQDNLLHFKYFHYPVNHGKGHALREGVKHAVSDFCIYTDIDFPYTEESFLNIYRELASGKADIAVGVRNETYYESVPAARVRISKTLRFFAQKLLHLPVNDTQAGLKGFNARGRKIFLETTIDRYLFDLEFIRKASRQKDLKVTPVNVVLKPGIAFTKMKPQILLTESWNLLRAWLG